MLSEKKKYYSQATTLLLSVFKELQNNSSFLLGPEITDRKNRILVKNFGQSFSRENILFVDKFLLFAPSLAVTHDSIHSYSFNSEDFPYRTLLFKYIKHICYNLMPGQASIQLEMNDGSKKTLFWEADPGDTYAAIRAYEKTVHDGSYKSHALCLLACIYVLTALERCNISKLEETFTEIKKNTQQLLDYYKDTNDPSKKYGCFFSFDFVSCKFDQETVDYALERIAEVKEELRESESEERKENFSRAWDRKMEETRKQYEKMNRNSDS